MRRGGKGVDGVGLVPVDPDWGCSEYQARIDRGERN